jgi:hypothetical protein
MILSEKEILDFVSIITCAAGYIIYVWIIFSGKIKPHMFSWVIWTITEATAFAAQFSHGAGPGSWASGATTTACLIIAILSFVRGEKNMAREDCVYFLVALSAIPLWYITKTPLYALLLIISMDLIAFCLTAKKSWRKPWEENVTLYVVSGLRCLISLFAMENISLVTMIYPAALTVANNAVAAVVLYRRAILKKT